MDKKSKNIKSVCFTGHRPTKLGGYAANPISLWVKQELHEAIERAAKKGVKTFISGGALGVDQWAAEIVIKVRTERPKSYGTFEKPIELVIARPFPSQPNKWPQESKRQYEKLLQRADRIIEVSDDPYASWKLQKRNEWMVDNSDAVIAVWDGSQSGTGNCVKYAMKQKKPVLVIDPVKQIQKWILEGKLE